MDFTIDDVNFSGLNNYFKSLQSGGMRTITILVRTKYFVLMFIFNILLYNKSHIMVWVCHLLSLKFLPINIGLILTKFEHNHPCKKLKVQIILWDYGHTRFQTRVVQRLKNVSQLAAVVPSWYEG